MKTKPKCSCYGGFDCEVCNPDYYQAAKPKLTRESYDEHWNMKPTDTPRTDAASFSSRDPLELMQTSQQLEIELTHSLQNQVKTQTEVESLRDAFSHLTNEIECTPKCSSHQAGYCDCGRLDRAYAIADLIAQNPTK